MTRFSRPDCFTCQASANNRVVEGLRIDQTEDWSAILLDHRKRFELGSVAAGIMVAAENQGHVLSLDDIEPYAHAQRTQALYARFATSLVRNVLDPKEWSGDFDIVLSMGATKNRLSGHYYETIIPKL